MIEDPPAEIMEICMVIAEAGGSPVDYIGRSIRDIRKWLKARNKYVRKHNERIKNQQGDGG